MTDMTGLGEEANQILTDEDIKKLIAAIEGEITEEVIEKVIGWATEAAIVGSLLDLVLNGNIKILYDKEIQFKAV